MKNKRLSGIFFSALLFVCGGIAPCLADVEEVHDPIEGVNRGIFWFNDQLDIYLLEPVARGYDYIMPERGKKGVVSFFENLNYPSYLVSDLIQGKFDQVGLHTGRFVINSTIGLVGFIDVAEDMGLKEHKEDFGIALAYRGVPAGPYLVLPLLGPSNLRDAVGRAVDAALDPIAWLSYTNMSSSSRLAIQGGVLGVRVVSTRAGLIQAIETAKESSLDYYLFAQGAYYQYRLGVLTDGRSDAFDEETPGTYSPTAESIEKTAEQVKDVTQDDLSASPKGSK